MKKMGQLKRKWDKQHYSSQHMGKLLKYGMGSNSNYEFNRLNMSSLYFLDIGIRNSTPLSSIL
jgi:hypothetical protein